MNAPQMNTRRLVEAEYAARAPQEFTRLFKVDLTDVEEVSGTRTSYWNGTAVVDDKSWEVDGSDRSGGGLFELIDDDAAWLYAMSKLKKAGFDTDSDEFQEDWMDGTLDMTLCIGTVAWVTYDPDEKKYSPFSVTQTPAQDHEVDYGPGSSTVRPPSGEMVRSNPDKTRYVNFSGQGRLPDEYRHGGNGEDPYEDD